MLSTTVSIARVAMASAGLMIGTTAVAQQAAPTVSRAELAEMDSYVCTFTGKCVEDADTPTRAAPPTRGFRLATSTPAVQPGGTTPGVRANYRGAGTVETRRGARTPRWSGARQPRYTAPVDRVIAPGAVVSAPRADLMLPFAYNSARLTRSGEARARTFARALKLDALKDKRFLIEGHTDLRGSRDLNMDLSLRRAQAVADYLVTQGVDRTRVEVKGVGPDEPLPGRSAKAEANRRVEAVLLS